MPGMVMGIRKSRDASFVVDGERSEWFRRSQMAMHRAGFGAITVDPDLGFITGQFSKPTVCGSLEVTLRPTTGGTEVVMHTTAAYDNIFALFKSPTEKIMRAFRDQLVT